MNSDSDQENNSPKWDTTQERKMCYRKMLNKVEAIEESDDFGLEAAKEIKGIIKQVNDIEAEHDITERFQHPDETLLDCKVLARSSDVLVKCLKNVDINTNTYEAAEFAKHVVAFCSDEAYDTESLLKFLPTALEIIPQTPACNFLFGTYDLQNLPQPKKKKERVKRQKDKFEKKEPEKVTNIQEEEKGINEIVKTLFDVLTECYERNNERPIRYYDYVIDTSSFSNTIENMFYCSFLVRDGKAHINLDDKNEPVIKPMRKRELKQFRDGGGVNSQIISSISWVEWETFKKDGYIQKYKKQQ